MALATQCPYCHTSFRVAADQLKLRGGMVRCGACNEVFDGNAHLIDLDAPPKPVPEVAPLPPPPPPSAIEAFGAALDAFDAQVAASAAQPPDIIPEPPAAPEPVMLPDIPDTADAADASDTANTARDEIERGGLPLLRQAAAVSTVQDAQGVPTLRVAARSKSRGPGKSGGPRPKWAAANPHTAPRVDPDEPEFLKRGRELERTGHKRQIAMLAGAALLTLALLVQAVTTFRNTLAARFPAMAPTLAGLCTAFGCKLALPMQIDALSIETGELQTIGADTFSLVTLLRNQSALSQAWPSIELELTDAGDKALVRRVFAPGEYLPAGHSTAAGFGARSEQAVKLHFQLKDVKASGYHIAVFYP